jgi:hypothetical protein
MRNRTGTWRRAAICFGAMTCTLTFTGCRDLQDDAVEGKGTIRIALTVQGSVIINAVDWRVLSATSAVLAQGTINTANMSSSPSVSVGVPSSSGDRVTMNATTSVGTMCTGTSAPFDVVAGQATAVSVTVNCGTVTPDGGLGSVVVNGMVVAGDNCPMLTTWSISPQQTAANGGAIDVAVGASDADMGDTLSYTWSATAGGTQYHCGAAGDHTLSVTVTDNHTPTPCAINVSFPPVTCL